MTVVPRQVDQFVLIGERTLVGPTDIDPRGVRVLIRGEVFGGSDDGARVDRAVELSVGQSVSIGPHVIVYLMAVVGTVARLGVMAPPNLGVTTKESHDSTRRRDQP